MELIENANHRKNHNNQDNSNIHANQKNLVRQNDQDSQNLHFKDRGYH